MESKTKNIKNSLGATWNASHLAVRLCALRHWKRVSMPPTTQSLRHPLTRAHHIAPRIKTARLRRKTNLQKSDYPKTRIKRGPNALCVLEYDNLYLCQTTINQCVILIIGRREISRPYQNVGYRLEKFDAVFYQEIILSPGVFRRETARGFYPWGNVESLRQMRSIPHCSKAVFYVFVFYSSTSPKAKV